VTPNHAEHRFWIANITVWAAYAAVSMAMGHAFAGGLSSGIALVSVLLGVFLCVSSGALRAVALRRNWLDLEAGALALRLLGAVALFAAATQAFIIATLVPALRLGWVDFVGTGSGFRPAAVAGYWVNTAILLGLWTAGWAGWRALRRARASELAAVRAESAHRALELDALRARLNPHFVFNALNNLRALILEDPERARELVTRLSNTLRHALEHSQQEWTTLRQELQVVQDYLAVESVHYEDRLQRALRIDEAVLDARIPPMALQLLVENAIKHGIARTAGGGELSIRARLRGGDLVIEVVNPGRLHDGPGGTGVGLAFLRNRLRPSGGRFELGVDGGCVVATLEIPQ
jgi:two-component sensor histidine kinase